MINGDVDRMVEAWLLCEFRKHHPKDHMATCVTAYASLQPATGWECGCYSSWTREDDFRLYYVVGCEHGNTFEGSQSQWYTNPTVVFEELDAYKAGLESVCHIENRDYND